MVDGCVASWELALLVRGFVLTSGTLPGIALDLRKHPRVLARRPLGSTRRRLLAGPLSLGSGLRVLRRPRAAAESPGLGRPRRARDVLGGGDAHRVHFGRLQRGVCEPGGGGRRVQHTPRNWSVVT